MPQKAPIYKPLPEAQVKYNTRIKEYPTCLKVSVFSKPIFNPHGYEEVVTKPTSRSYSKEKKDTSRDDAIKRAKDKAFDIAYANDFQYFITFTLSPEKVNRYDKGEILKKVKIWLKHSVERKDFKYLIFPEYHQDGAIHFHGLCSGNLTMIDSGKETKNGQTIYNCADWGLGFTTAVKLESLDGENDYYAKVVSYIMKYITKENARVFSKHYFAGGHIKREVPSVYDNTDFTLFDGHYYKIPNVPLAVKYDTISKYSSE